MIRIVQLGDSHFCESSRFEECCALHDWIADWVASERPSAVVHTGDVYERASTPRERLAAAEFFAKCSGDCPVVVVRGNHDRPEDLALLERLDTVHPVFVRETPGVVSLYDVQLACLPWPRKSALLAALGAVPQEQAGQVAQDALRDVLRGLAQHKAPDAPSLLVAHAMVRGSITSHGQPLVGHDLELGLDDLALAGCDGVALGHVHAFQHWMAGRAPVVYSGSPRRTAFGETEAKGFVVWTLEPGQTARWEFVEVPATPMHLLETHYYSEHVGLPGDTIVPAGFATFDQPHSVRDAEIRFRYHVEAEHREAAARAAGELRERWLRDGASVVKLEPVVEVSTRARAPEIAQARTLLEQLDAHWQSKGGLPARRDQLVAKLGELEDVVQ